MKRCWLLLLITAVMMSACALSSASRRFPLQKGFLDLREWNPDKASTIDIIGNAEFAWQRLAMTDGWPETATFINYPGAWNIFSKHPAMGFASYRIRIKLPAPMKLSASFSLPWSASEIFINGELIHREGQPGRNAKETIGGMRGPFIWTWEQPTDQLDIVMQIANFDLSIGGPMEAVRIGTPFGVQAERDREVATFLFLIGAIFVMGFYHFSLFALRRHDHTALFFGIFCVTMVGFLLVSQPFGSLSLLIPEDFRVRVQVFNLAWTSSATAFMWYCAALFPNRLSRYFSYAMTLIAMGCAVLVLALPIPEFVIYTMYFHAVVAVGMLIIGHAVYNAWRRNEEGARTFIFFALILFLCCINDMLMLRGLIDTLSTAPVGAFLFIFGQAQILSVRFSRAFKRAEDSEAEVRQLNASLEIKVTEKTVNMQQMMNEMQGQRDKLQEVNTFISQHVLQRFLPPDLVADLVAGKQTFNDQPSMRDVTICFADLCSFTSATEWIGPQRVAKTLNEFLACMTQIIFDEGGTIDKFIGDGIMVIFGAPRELPPYEQAQRSCRCALRMQEGLRELNRKWKMEFDHEFQMRIGIHRGPALVGSFGSQLRSDYTAIGNTVNIASRVESQAKPGEVLITSMVRDYLGTIAWEAAGSYKLKGLGGEMVLFRLLKDEEQRVA